MFVREYTIKLLGTSFPNMTASEVTQFVNGLFESRTNLSIFKNHIRDFLVQSKEFSAQVKIPHSSKLVDCIKDVDAATVPYPYLNNAMFVREYTIKLLGTSFPNMTASEVTQFVNGLFESRTNLSIFKNHIRDFLVQSKEFSAQVKIPHSSKLVEYKCMLVGTSARS
uniref:Exportin-1 C-terminal domain-containing protein n=1 Tax=Salix viminalis TaxID=40686 RepID=A0A6N2KUN7_SALVM